jgi:hypothetical protein
MLKQKVSPVRKSRTDAELKAILADLSRPTKCVWSPEEHSSRAWLSPVDHPEEDSEHPSMQNVWRFCPYCGKEIEIEQVTADTGAEHGK